jgi:hypothetical protein
MFSPLDLELRRRGKQKYGSDQRRMHADDSMDLYLKILVVEPGNRGEGLKVVACEDERK